MGLSGASDELDRSSLDQANNHPSLKPSNVPEDLSRTFIGQSRLAAHSTLAKREVKEHEQRSNRQFGKEPWKKSKERQGGW